MALPTDIATLHAWYKAGSLSLNEGDEIASWVDSSGNGRTMTGATAGTTKPQFRANQLAGYPAVEIVRLVNASYFSCGTFGWLASLAAHTIFIVWRATNTAATGGIVSSAGGGPSEAIVRPAANTIRKRWTNTVPTTYTADATLNDEQWHYACGWQTAGQIGINADGGADVTTATAGTRSANPTAVGYIGEDGGGFCDGRIAEIIVYSSALSAGNRALINAYLRDKYFGVAPGQQEQVRDAMSRRQWALRRPQTILDVEVPFSIGLDVDIMDRVAIETQYGPASDGLGWRARKWARPGWSVQTQVVGGETVKLTLLKRSPLDILMWDTACTDLVNSGARQAGVCRLMRGIGFTFSRQSQVWIPNPADPTSLVACAQNERAINQTGEYLEEQRTNEVKRSSFVSGTTGLTLAGTGTNGSAIGVDTADLMFGTETTGNSLKFTAGSPHAAELRATFPATASIAGGSTVALSIDHKTDNGEGLYCRVQRGVDSWYLKADGTWQAGSVDLTMPTHADRDPADRFIKVFGVGAGATTLTVSVFLQTGGTASRISHLYHVQLEVGSFPTSRIVTDAAAVTRVKTELSHSITTALKSLNPALGGIYFQLTTDWSSSELGATEDQYLFYMTTNGGADHLALFYDASAAGWRLESKVGGSTVAATKAAAVTRGTLVEVAGRWTGADGELGLANYTLSVFVDKVKGTDATSAAPTFTSPETLYRGSDSSFAHHVNAAVRELRIFPHAPSDTEIARLP